MRTTRGLSFPRFYLMASEPTLGYALLSSYGLQYIYLPPVLMGIAVASMETYEPVIIVYIKLCRSMGPFIGDTNGVPI